MEISEKIRFVRERLKISQEDLARALNVSYATINRWENARTKPNKMAQDVFHNFCAKHGIVFDESGDIDD
jgi:DNA-binding transcriptional regulator YiaG